MRTRPPRRQSGVSLIELMISVTIGLLLMSGLVTLFVNSSDAERESRKASEQIENGRYAIDVISQDLRIAGFYGPFNPTSNTSFVPTSLPDACDSAIASLQSALGLPVQGFQTGTSFSATATPSTSCATWLTSANLAAGSDILVVRRADTTAVVPGAATTAGEVYLQANPQTLAIQAGGGTTSCTSDASGGSTATITRKCLNPPTSDVCPTTCAAGTTPAGEIRKLRVHIYFVAPCSLPANGSDICTGATDDSGSPIPTLKRLEITAASGATTFKIFPIAEGVQYMKVEYGIDDQTGVKNVNAANNTNLDTGLIGDGSPDRYTYSPSLADYSNVVSVRVDLLMRNRQPSQGYVDSKTYSLGVDPASPSTAYLSLGPYNDGYRRHVYAAETRLINLSGRKENP